VSPLETYLVVGTALAAAWVCRRPATALLWDGRKRFEAGQAGADTPRRADAVALQATELVICTPRVVDHEAKGWLGGDHEFTTVRSAPREAARSGHYPLPFDHRRSA
jgi:hypothetical protein